MKFFGSIFLFLGLMFGQAISAHAEVQPYRAEFSIAYQGIESDLEILTATVMPSKALNITTSADATSATGKLEKSAAGWSWIAPNKPGRHEIVFAQRGKEILLNVFVLTPFANGTQTSLNGYDIGSYKKALYRGLETYAEPEGFIDLAHGPADLKISPHFTLGQFICKQKAGESPTYLLIRPGLLVKLESLLGAARKKGWDADTLHVMSGFRTPHYNRGIGNKTTSSMHLYGGAADVWIDSDGDGRMDDLNKDGKYNKDDARVFAKMAENLAAKGGKDWPSGGIGIYKANAAHGPFVHIDARGYAARWGH